MRDENEIRKKIDEWEEKQDDSTPADAWTIDDSKTRNDQEISEYIYGVIDALLWVIGDESGMAI